jgi:4-azaleucine resistance transporter AzlC
VDDPGSGVAPGPRTDSDIDASRRRLLLDAFGIALSAAGFGFIFGLASREAGLTVVEASAMSLIVFGGASQFAAVGYIAAGLAWPAIILLTGLVNARHLLYSAALSPWLRGVPWYRRAVMAHLLTDEAFALTTAHFTRIGRTDERGYWIAAIVATLVPWNVATIAGVVLGGELPDTVRSGLGIIFPAAMIGLATGLISGRRELAAAVAGGGIGVVVALLASPSIGIVAGGVFGPLIGFLVPARPDAEPSLVPAAERDGTP